MELIKENKAKSNSYLTFKIGEELFASHVSSVNNIVEVPKITKVPKSPDYLVGVMNLRGSVLPVIDTRLKFGKTSTKVSKNTCILILEINVAEELVYAGALVDSVQEVIEIKEDQILPPPQVGQLKTIEFIYGIVKVREEFVMLVNMNLIFGLGELDNITDKVNKTNELLKSEV